MLNFIQCLNVAFECVNMILVMDMEFKLKRFEKALEVSRIANIHYFEFTKQYHTFKDRHSFRELLYVDSGFITVDSDNYSGTVRENHIIIHNADEYHSLTCPDDEASNVIIIGFECNCCELDVFSCQPTLLNDGQKRLLTEIIKEGRSVFLPPYDVPNQKDMKKRKDYPFGADQMIKIKMENLLIELVRNYKNVSEVKYKEISDQKISEICNYIDRNYKERITLDELCFLFGTNKTSLCSQFKAVTGETAVSYINKLRIKEAKKLLRNGVLNLTEISAEVGFSSVHYFSRTFKQYEKQSPNNYIKTIKSRLVM